MNNFIYNLCRQGVIKDLEKTRLFAGMSITDEEQYNKCVDKRAKISFWYWVIITPLILYILVSWLI